MTGAAGISGDAASAGAGPVVLHVRVLRGCGGGPEETILRSAAYLAAAGYEPVAAYMHPPRDPEFERLARRAREHGCPLVGIPDAAAFDARVVLRLARLCRSRGVRVWHGHDYKSNLLGLLLRPLHRMALVSTVHGWVTRSAKLCAYYAIDRLCLRRYDRVASVSPDLHRRLLDFGVDEERCSLIPNGVDENAFRRRRPAAEGKLRIRRSVPPGRAVVGAVGRLSGEKGFEHLLDAAARLLAGGLDLEVWIAGEGPARAALQRAAARLAIAERIHLLGHVDDPAEVYESLDVFALPSLREGLPIALLEAMASSLPAVATPVAGVPSVIDDGANGLLCPTADPEALAAALRRLLADAALRQRLGAAARATVERRFKFSARMAREVEMYDRLLGRHRARP